MSLGVLQPGFIPSSARPATLARWLGFVAILIVLIVVVGGITRLTESGLSITEWKPVAGALPPLNDADWQAAFDLYRQTPEYQQINRGMSLSEFQFIFFWEWVHRQLGRLIGLALALPLIWFAVRRRIPHGYTPRLVALVALVALQGTLGWWMVQSGLADRTDVSHYRLAAHLLTALFLLAGTVWTALDLTALAASPAARPARVVPVAAIAGSILFVQLLFGAYTAGLNAGLVTDQWPLMNGRLFPAEEFAGRSAVDAVFNDPFVIHFVHRWWAWVAAIALIVLAGRVKRAGVRPASIAIHALLGIQILLGIATVMTGVNLHVAVTHQLVGALLVIAVTWGAHILGRTPA
jgi:cytochrome c oxidase assembly protein subunit 15